MQQVSSGIDSKLISIESNVTFERVKEMWEKTVSDDHLSPTDFYWINE